MSDLHTEKLLMRPLCLHSNSLLSIDLSIIRSNELIINVYHEDDQILPLLSNIRTDIRLRCNEAHRLEPGVDLFVEISRRLFKAVEQLVGG